ncbi:MAG: thioredoxin family protein [Candidatus Heimdallarchaeota archaeon]
MNKHDSFNKLFENGISYKEYTKKSDKHKERMNDSFNAGQMAVNRLPQDKVSLLNEKLRVLCIAESWCGDCANGVPIIAVLADILPNWTFRISSRDSYPDEIESFYSTAGRKKIPVIVFADEDGDEIMRWIERPMRSYRLLGKLKDQNLTKERYLEQYKDTLEFKPPFVSEEILKELIRVAEKAASIVRANPPSKKVRE